MMLSLGATTDAFSSSRLRHMTTSPVLAHWAFAAPRPSASPFSAQQPVQVQGGSCRPYPSSPLPCRCAVDSSSPAESSSQAGSGKGRSSNRGGASGNEPFRDTRIHWGDSDDGWLGIEDGASGFAPPPQGSASSADNSGRKSESGLSDALRDLVSQAKDSHYRFLGISTSADLDTIKSAFRRLSKQYHPDTTELPLEVAAQKFMQLKEAYTVLSNERDRLYYDWKLAQKVSREQVQGNSSWSYNGDRDQIGITSRPPRQERYVEPVDALSGDNLPLSDQAQTALVFDLFALLVSVVVVIYVSFFKNPQ